MIQQASSAPRITTIDISGPTRALGLLRWSDYLLVVVCGLGAVGLAPEFIRAIVESPWSDVCLFSAMAAVFTFAAYTGWRHVGVIDPRVWRSYLLVFPLMLLLASFIGLGVLLNLRDGAGTSLENPQSWLTILVLVQFAGMAIPGFVCVLYLKRARITPGAARLPDVLTHLWNHGGSSGLTLTKHQRIDTRRGLAYGALGVLVLAAVMVIPVPDGRMASSVLRTTQQLNVLAFFLMVRARRYFQVSADSLLAVDRRAPILFLRSFADDEKQQYNTSQRALLDFSLETRLANHFYRFGPFIAIGSPQDDIPQPGAARVLLRDDEWQGRVLGWMRDAHLIVMYCGTTEWVNWELRKVIDSERATSLILMFPEIRGWRKSKRAEDIAARTQQLRKAFQDTPWTEELTAFDDYENLRAMLFCADGSMVMIRSKSRTRDAYHLAALVAHQQLIDPAEVMAPRQLDEPRPRVLRWVVAGGLSVLALAMMGLAFVLASASGDAKLTFKRGELYYSRPVTEPEARRVGEHLVRHEIFSDDHGSTVQLHLEDGRYRLRFVVSPDYVNDPLTAMQFGAIGSQVAREVLGGRATEVTLADPTLKEVKTVSPSDVLEYGNSSLFFTPPVAESDARAVGNALAKGFFSEGRAAVVQLGWEDAAFQLRFVVDPSRANAPDVLRAFTQLGAVLSMEVLGRQPVVVHLCDERLRTVRRMAAGSSTIYASVSRVGVPREAGAR